MMRISVRLLGRFIETHHDRGDERLSRRATPGTAGYAQETSAQLGFEVSLPWRQDPPSIRAGGPASTTISSPARTGTTAKAST